MPSKQNYLYFPSEQVGCIGQRCLIDNPIHSAQRSPECRRVYVLFRYRLSQLGGRRLRAISVSLSRAAHRENFKCPLRFRGDNLYTDKHICYHHLFPP